MKELNLFKLTLFVFGISWLGVIPSLLIAYGVQIPTVFKYFEILMTIGPILGAALFVYLTNGKTGLRNLFKRLLFFKARPIVIIAALLTPILISYLAASIGFGLSNANWPSSFDSHSILRNGIMIALSYLIVNTEEIVWRGVVFDKLLDKYGFLKSCGIIAPIWWLFHIPLFLYPGGHQAGYSLVEFTFMVIALTFILGWIYVNSHRSLLYVHLHHQLINGFGQAFPIFPVFIAGNLFPIWIFCTLLLIMAVFLIYLTLRGWGESQTTSRSL